MRGSKSATGSLRTAVGRLTLLGAVFSAWTFAPGGARLQDLAGGALTRIDGDLEVPGLRSAVQVVRDRWGVPHIYAASEEDLFFAQGYVAAENRLWQVEMWRRSAEGRLGLAEILGPEAAASDRLAQLRKHRGPVDDPDAPRLMTAFVAGVNAFLALRANRLPIEFTLTGIRPEPWTVATLLLRQIAFGDATSELQLARAVLPSLQACGQELSWLR